jgi:hypothetical protein
MHNIVKNRQWDEVRLRAMPGIACRRRDRPPGACTAIPFRSAGADGRQITRTQVMPQINASFDMHQSMFGIFSCLPILSNYSAISSAR